MTSLTAFRFAGLCGFKHKSCCGLASAFKPPIVAGVVLASLLLSGSAFAQRDPQAISIISQSLIASGFSTSIKDSVATGNITLWDGTSGSITIKTLGLGFLRTEININGNQITTVSSPGKGYMVQSGIKSDLPIWITKYRRANHIAIFSRMADYAQPNTDLTYVGQEAISGIPVHHILMSSLPKDGTPAKLEALISEFHVFVNTTSLLPVKTLSFDLSDSAMENRVPIETYYRDYQSVNGVLVPFQVTRYLRGTKQTDLVLTSVQLNVGLSPSDFE